MDLLGTQFGQSNPKEEPLEMMKLLILPPSRTEASGDMTENTDGEALTEVERRLQRKKEKYEVYNRIYVSQLSNEEESKTNTDDAQYTYFR